MTTKQLVLDAVAVSVENLLLYDRQDDIQLGVGGIDRAIATGEIAVKEVVEQFERELTRRLDPTA